MENIKKSLSKDMKCKKLKKECKFLIHILLDNNMIFKWTIFKMHWSCILWDLRGLQTCPHHGFYTQSYFTGYCKKCGEIPILPPMEDTCIFCTEEKAVLQRVSPNYDEKDIWSLCWECDQYITWGQELSWCQQAEAISLNGEMVKPFDEWLFDKHQVYPKGKYSEIVLKKLKKN